MIVEALILGCIAYTYNNWDKINIRRKWKQITYSKNEFTNKLDKTLKIWSIQRTGYGHIIQIELPYGYTFEQLQKDLDVFKEGLGYKAIQLKTENNIVDMYCIKEFNFNLNEQEFSHFFKWEMN